MLLWYFLVEIDMWWLKTKRSWLYVGQHHSRFSCSIKRWIFLASESQWEPGAVACQEQLSTLFLTHFLANFLTLPRTLPPWPTISRGLKQIAASRPLKIINYQGSRHFQPRWILLSWLKTRVSDLSSNLSLKPKPNPNPLGSLSSIFHFFQTSSSAVLPSPWTHFFNATLAT